MNKKGSQIQISSTVFIKSSSIDANESFWNVNISVGTDT